MSMNLGNISVIGHGRNTQYLREELLKAFDEHRPMRCSGKSLERAKETLVIIDEFHMLNELDPLEQLSNDFLDALKRNTIDEIESHIVKSPKFEPPVTFGSRLYEYEGDKIMRSNLFNEVIASTLAISNLGYAAKRHAIDRRNRMTDEELREDNQERAIRIRTNEINSRARYYNNHLSMGICPFCKAKVIRGKKNKQGKRGWTCNACDKVLVQINTMEEYDNAKIDEGFTD